MQIVRFGAVSIVATVADVGTLMLLKRALPDTMFFLTVAIAIAYAAGIVSHFMLARRWVFDPSHMSFASEFASVFVVGLVAWGLTELITVYLYAHAHWPLLFAKTAAIGIVFFWNFLARRRFIYKGKPAADTATS